MHACLPTHHPMTSSSPLQDLPPRASLIDTSSASTLFYAALYHYPEDPGMSGSFAAVKEVLPRA